MFTSLGKMPLISNDLKATKLLNQQSLPLSSSLKFALFLCQAFRQSSLKPDSRLQTYTYVVQHLLEKGGELVWSLGFMSSPTSSPALHNAKERKGPASKFPCRISSCRELCSLGARYSPHPPAFHHSMLMFAFVNRFNLSKINSRRELLLAENQLWKDGGI